MEMGNKDERLETFIRLQTRGQEVSAGEKKELLLARKTRLWFMLSINIVVVGLFGYSIFNGISSLPSWVFWALTLISGLNIGLLAYQFRQIAEAVAYLEKQAL